MKKTSFIQLGLVTAALAYGISSMYVGVVDNQVQDDYNPVVVVNELPQVAQAIDDLKEVKNIDVKEDVKMFTSMLIELEDVKTNYNLWQLKNSTILDDTVNYESWNMMDKVIWINKVGNLQNIIQEFESIEKRYFKIKPKVESYDQQSKELTNYFINNKDSEKLLEIVSNSYKDLKEFNEKVVTTYKVINYLNANASGLSNVQKMQESPLKTHLGKITELNSKVENSLKEHNGYNQKIEEMKNYQLATIDGQRDWVVEVNKLIQKIKTKEKIEEMNKDLHQVNQEIKPIVDEVKKLESKDKKTLDMKKIVSLIKEQKQMAQSSSTNQTKLKI
jgi:hypothetical protein